MNSCPLPPPLPSSCSYKRDDFVKPYKAPKADPGEGCPRCGGKVFAAEEMLAKGKVGSLLCVVEVMYCVGGKIEWLMSKFIGY